MIKYLFVFVLSLPKIIYVNFKVFEIKTAVRLPMLVSYKTKISSISKNSIEIKKPSFAKVRFDFFDGTLGVTPNKGILHISNGGKVVFCGKANLAKGAALRVEGGILEVGNNFACNANSFISCSYEIKVGDDNLWGWNINVRDSDGHKIFDSLSHEYLFDKASVIFGNKVWLGANAHVLKRSIIPKHSIVGYGALVSKPFNNEGNVIIAGYPAKVIKENVQWEH